MRRIGLWMWEHRAVVAVAGTLLVCATGAAIAAQTNFLGVVFVADPTNTARQLAVNSDGSINIVTH